MASTAVRSVLNAASPHQDHSATISFEPFDLPSSNQRRLGPPHPEGTVSPLALKPTGDSEISLENAIESVKALQANSSLLTQKLAQHGALLFRGLPIESASDFSRFAHAFGYKPHEIIGIVVDRPLLAPNVAPANEAPKEVLIFNHNESPQVPHAPEYVFFYGHKAPHAGGGETPVSSSLELFYRVQQEIPGFIQQLAEKGILSRVTYKVSQQYAGGSTLKQAFGKYVDEDDNEDTRRAKVEAQIARYGRGKHTTFTWSEDGTTLVLEHRLPAIRRQPDTGLPTLFTGLAGIYKNFQSSNKSRASVVTQTFGDGTPIPIEDLQKLAEITEDIRVLHTWQQGDVLVFDNIVAQHGRQPWLGEQEDRIVMASLWDGDSVPGAYGDQDWAQVVQALDDVVY